MSHSVGCKYAYRLLKQDKGVQRYCTIVSLKGAKVTIQNTKEDKVLDLATLGTVAFLKSVEKGTRTPVK